MHQDAVIHVVRDLLWVVAAGFVSGLICKRIGAALLIGYLVAGSTIGAGGLGLVTKQGPELRDLSEVGALLLLFSVGIEFSPADLKRLGRYFLVGGPVQMLLVAVPLALAARAAGLSWNGAVLAGAAGSLSSTVLVYRSLSELGQTSSPHGRGAIGVLLFQDVALVPLLLLLPLLTGSGSPPTLIDYLVLALKAGLFVMAVLVLRTLIGDGVVPLLARLRSVELVVLFTVSLLTGVCVGAVWLGLPAAVGALAAGVALSGNRLSKQIDTILLPFRELFAAIFFVTTGSLLDPAAFIREPILLTAGLLGVLLVKTIAGAIGLRGAGLKWPAALGMGLGLCQMGEFSLILASEGVRHRLIDSVNADRMLAIAIGTLILTPYLLKVGLARAQRSDAETPRTEDQWLSGPVRVTHATVIGIGPIGRQVASRLEIMGCDVCLVDLSPINLHPFEQSGFHVVSGDARDEKVLRRAHVPESDLIIVSVPDDDVALQTLQSLRAVNKTGKVLVRCRFQINAGKLARQGADAVVSEEAEASGRLINLCEKYVRASHEPITQA